MTTTATSSALTERIRNQWALVSSQWVDLPGALQKLLGEMGDRLRSALDLPTRDEMAKLAARLDDLDARLASLTMPPAIPTVAEKRVRRK